MVRSCAPENLEIPGSPSGRPGMTSVWFKEAMTHPGEQFYPEGVRWDDTIVQGSLPDLLSKAAADYGPRTPREFRDRPITYTELAAMAERAAAAFLRAGCGKNTSVALF